MEYYTAKDMAEQWDVNIRTVQKWAKDGKLVGAKKVGRDWMIPEETQNPMAKTLWQEEDLAENSDDILKEKRPDRAATQRSVPAKENIPAQKITHVQIMPLMAGSFQPGQALEYVNTLSGEAKILGKAEWHYYRGESLRAVLLTEQLLRSKDHFVRISALLVHAFASMHLNRISTVRQDFHSLSLEKAREGKSKPDEAFSNFAVAMCKVLLHDTNHVEFELQERMRELPDGVCLFAAYIMAHYYYLEGNYERALGVSETAIALLGDTFPVGKIYLFLVVAISLISVKDLERAERYFMQAWEIAKVERFFEPFAEHHGLLGGLVEKCLKKTDPESYQTIIQMVYDFSEGWREIHNPDTKETVTNELTTTEFSIAMLASKGWSNKEIAAQILVSESTIKNVTKAIYQKLQIKGRKELKQYMLR